jgi:hypothetical protein
MAIGRTVLAALAITIPLIAQTHEFERILLPLAVEDHPGAFGTVWSTEAQIINVGDTPLDIFLSSCDYECASPGGPACVVTICFPFEPTAAGAPFTERSLTRNEVGGVVNPATLVYIPRGSGDRIAASLRLSESASNANEFGLEIPVVREDELFTGPLWLPSVPMPEDGRTHLRIYAVESANGRAEARVRVYSGESVVAALDIVVSNFVGGSFPGTPTPRDYRHDQPSYLFLSLSHELTSGMTPLRIRIDPVTPGLKFWAMASVTSNATQHVTLVTPQ